MKKKYFIAVFLIAIICILSIGYAVCKSELTITSSANITSNWDIEITSINVKSISGHATKAIEPVISGTTATFKTNLESPGDSMTYEVTVTNNGNVDAKVDKIETTDSLNPAITFTTNGINQNDLLEAGQSASFEVTTAYSDGINTQPDDITATFSLKLTYIQNT